MGIVHKIILGAATVFLLLFVGVMAGQFRIFPYPVFAPFAQVVEGTLFSTQIENYNFAIRWKQPAPAKAGLLKNDPAQTQGDVTLYTTAHDQTVRLIDNTTGDIVHSWTVPFSTLWPKQEHLIKPRILEDSFFYLRDAELYSDGSIVAMYGVGGLTPWGAGLVKVDKNGAVIWKIADFFYNDVTRAPDGTLYALFHKPHQTPVQGLAVAAPFLEDNIAIIAQDGTRRDEISVFQAFAHSPFADMIRLLQYRSDGDYTHTNSIEIITRDVPGIEWMRAGNLVLSHRNISAFSVIDPRSKSVIHAEYLPTRQQHDIRITPRDTLQVFDNQGGLYGAGYSRVLEFDPLTLAIYRELGGTPAHPLESEQWGAAGVLEEGHILVVAGEQGRIFETNGQGDIVWEYVLPFSNRGNIPVVTMARRFNRADLEFLK